MLSQARELELTVTGTALEAALEEADTIKRLAPPYNKALRARDRSVVFATPHLDRVSPTADSEHRLGPLAGGDLWRAVELLTGSTRDAAPADVLSVPASYAPQPETFVAGLELFQSEIGTTPLLAHGAQMWRAQVEADDDEPQEEFRLEMQYDVGVDRWSPERVASALHEIVRRAAHQVRRGYWLCLLSESTLVWSDAALEIVRGRIHARRNAFAPRSFPPFAERRGAFDTDTNIDTLDRMIVLTKEIRRLVSEGREVRLHVGDTAVLDETKLAAMLRWI